MRIQAWMTMAAVMTAWGAGNTGSDRSVVVCEEGGPRPWSMLARAEAAKIFADVGITINWRIGLHECLGKANGIAIHISYHTPRTLLPNALAYALPFDGTQVVVFYDRVQMTGDPHLLAYVFVHEIAHILQGCDRHSETGIMKPRWGSDDFYEMDIGRLQFTDSDVTLMYLGLDGRKAWLAARSQRLTVLQ